MNKTKEMNLNQKLDLILENQKQILENEQKILGEEQKIEELENKELEFESREVKSEKDVLKELDDLEEKLKNNVQSPLRTISEKDFIKGFIGAFIGVVSHFTFVKATSVASHLTILNTIILYITAFVMIIAMLYYSGFRKIEKKIILKFLPLRALVLYFVSVLAILIAYLLFGYMVFPIDLMNLFHMVGASIILAVLGAGTADLIGRGD